MNGQRRQSAQTSRKLCGKRQLGVIEGGLLGQVIELVDLILQSVGVASLVLVVLYLRLLAKEESEENGNGKMEKWKKKKKKNLGLETSLNQALENGHRVKLVSHSFFFFTSFLEVTRERKEGRKEERKDSRAGKRESTYDVRSRDQGSRGSSGGAGANWCPCKYLVTATHSRLHLFNCTLSHPKKVPWQGKIWIRAATPLCGSLRRKELLVEKSNSVPGHADFQKTSNSSLLAFDRGVPTLPRMRRAITNTISQKLKVVV